MTVAVGCEGTRKFPEENNIVEFLIPGIVESTKQTLYIGYYN